MEDLPVSVLEWMGKLPCQQIILKPHSNEVTLVYQIIPESLSGMQNGPVVDKSQIARFEGQGELVFLRNPLDGIECFVLKGR